MKTLPQPIQQYFQGALFGLDALLPWGIRENTGFLSQVYQALSGESHYTEKDVKHLQTLMAIVDRVRIPIFTDAKSFIETETYILTACVELGQTQVRYCLGYLYCLLSRHGLIREATDTARRWFRVWRVVQRFEPLTQGFVTDYIDWLCTKGFSVPSIYDCVLELFKFQDWMKQVGFESIEAVTEVDVIAYLKQKCHGGKNTSRQKHLSNLKPVFYYYKATVNGQYRIPEVTVYAPTMVGVNQSANSREIAKLLKALADESLPTEGGLMLALVLCLGLPLKALPHLQFDPFNHTVTYHAQRPCLLGTEERIVRVPSEPPWLLEQLNQYKATPTSSPYLFTTRYALRRGCPVSVDHCQERVQSYIQRVLGYPIPVNYLMRGILKVMARQHHLPDFMARAQTFPLSRQTKLMYWLQHNKGHGGRGTKSLGSLP